MSNALCIHTLAKTLPCFPACNPTCVAELLLDVDVVAVTELVVVATWGQHEVRGTPPLSITNVNMNCLKLRPLGLLHVATSENKTLRPP